MKVLLADDDADQLDLRSLTLTKAGYEISAAGDPATALEMAVQTNPEVAVVDLKIPTEEAGLRLIRDLKKLDSRLRVILLTGSDPKKVQGLPEYEHLEAVFTKGNASRLLIEHLRRSSLLNLRRRLQSEGQLTLDVKVIPRASNSEITEVSSDGTLKVRVAAVPEKGTANSDLISLLAESFGIARNRVELLSGETSQRKRVRLRAT